MNQCNAGRSGQSGLKVNSVKARLAASSGLIALTALVTVLGAPWKW